MLVDRKTLTSKNKLDSTQIYDCFMFFNELEILKLRLEYLSPYVDYFVIVESRKTLQGKHKSLFFEENKEKFQNHLHKIKHIIINDFPTGVAPFTMESIQRNAMTSCLKNCNDHDLIMISDIDELPKVDRIPKKIDDGVVYHFLQDQRIYFANVYKEKHIVWQSFGRFWKPNLKMHAYLSLLFCPLLSENL